ncbi:MAG: amidohydrolase family protein [Bauldia sp.]|nr:amidohydrolase family protein [Bauldia sp.]
MQLPTPRRYYEQTPEEWRVLGERLAAAGPEARILLRGATVITVDPTIGDFDEGDVLIDGGKIEAVAPDLSGRADGAITIDMGGMIVLPGIIDGHRHCWQNQFRRIIPDADLTEYMATLHGDFALEYRPHDIYVGNLVTMLSLLDSGVTCVTDCAHNTRTRAHADAAFKAYADSGIRAVHAGAPSNAGDWEGHLPADLLRLREQYCSGPDSLTTVRMFIDVRRVMPAPDLFAFARDHGLGITMDAVIGHRCNEIVELGRAGLLGPDLTLIHCNDMPEEGWELIAGAGTKVTLATTSEQQLGLGSGVPVIQAALDHGIRPCLSGDVEVCLAGDMFTQMRTTLTTQRMLAKAKSERDGQNVGNLISHSDVLEFATRRAADAIGLCDQIGSLTPGKYADLIAIRAEDINNLPLNNAVGTVVLATESRNIDIVFVGGAIRKWQGELVGQDIDALRTLVRDSRDHIAERVGFRIRPTGRLHVSHEDSQRRHSGDFDSIKDLMR